MRERLDHPASRKLAALSASAGLGQLVVLGAPAWALLRVGETPGFSPRESCASPWPRPWRRRRLCCSRSGGSGSPAAAESRAEPFYRWAVARASVLQVILALAYLIDLMLTFVVRRPLPLLLPGDAAGRRRLAARPDAPDRARGWCRAARRLAAGRAAHPARRGPREAGESTRGRWGAFATRSRPPSTASTARRRSGPRRGPGRALPSGWPWPCSRSSAWASCPARSSPSGRSGPCFSWPTASPWACWRPGSSR